MDAALGWMSDPVVVPPDEVLTGSTTNAWARRIAVREERCKCGVTFMRTRTVDHMTENGLNKCTVCNSQCCNDSLQDLTTAGEQWLSSDVKPELFKCDVSAAFRRVPVAPCDWWTQTVIFYFASRLWCAHHKTFSFGAYSSVVSWHRVASAFLSVCRVLFYASLLKYVDDYFGWQRALAKMTTTSILSTVFMLCGFLLDPGKTAAGDALGEPLSEEKDELSSTTYCLR